MKKLIVTLLCVLMVAVFMPTMVFAAVSETDVAQVGDTGYATLQAAIEAGNGKTVQLIKDVDESVKVPEGTTLTLDLNGCVLKGTPVDKTPAIYNDGTITIVSAKEGGKITRDTSKGSYYVVDNQGTMTVESGEISVKSPDSMPVGSSLVRNAGKGKVATLNINGGKLHQDGFIAVKNDDEGVLNVTAGAISTFGDTDTHVASAIQNWGTANISGGTIGNVWAGTWDNKFESKTVISGTAKVEGKIIVKKDGTPEIKPDVKITGGDFDVEWRIVKEEAVVQISGGSYTEAPDSDFITATEVANVKEDGTTKTVVGLTDINKALENAGEGTVVTVTKASEGAVFVAPAGVMVENQTAAAVKVNDTDLAAGADVTVEEPQGPVDPDEPGGDEPGGDEPGGDEPGTDEPGTDEPGTDEPGTDKPDADKPDDKEPAKEPAGDVSETGDEMTFLPWIALMILTVGAAVAIKKKENQ